MLNVAFYLLLIVMLSVVMLSVILLNVIILNVVMLNVIMLNVVMLTIVAPPLPARGFSIKILLFVQTTPDKSNYKFDELEI